MLLAGAHPHDAERRDIGRQTDGEGQLQPGNEDGVEIHEINPRTSVSPALVKLIRREWLTDAAGTQPCASQARPATDRGVPWPSCNRRRRYTWLRTRPPFPACRYRCDRGSAPRTARR